MLILITIFCLLFAFVAWRKIDWAIFLILALLPSYLIRFKIGFVPFTLLEAMILILFAVFVVKRFFRLDRKTLKQVQGDNGEAEVRIKTFSDVMLNLFQQLSNVMLNLFQHLKYFIISLFSQRGFFWLFVLFFLLSATISVFVSSERIAAFGIWKAYFVEPILFLIVIISCKPKFNLCLAGLGASALIVAVPAVIQWFTGWGIDNPFWRDEATRRVTSWYGFPNAVGLFLAPIVVLFLGLLWLEITNHCKYYKSSLQISNRCECYGLFKSRRIIFYFLVIVAGSAAIIFARSEGALSGILAGVIFVGIFYPNNKARIATLVSLVSLILLVLFIPAWRNYAVEKLTFNDLSGQIRVQQWKETLDMLKDGRALTGAGLANYQAAIKPYHQEGIWIKDKSDPKWLDKILYNEEYRKARWQPTEIYLYPHNFVLNFWSEIGLLGLLAILAIVIKFFVDYKTAKDSVSKKSYLALMAAMLAIIVHGTVDVPYFKNDLSVLFWIIVGMGIIVQRNRLKQGEEGLFKC